MPEAFIWIGVITGLIGFVALLEWRTNKRQRPGLMGLVRTFLGEGFGILAFAAIGFVIILCIVAVSKLTGHGWEWGCTGYQVGDC